MSPLKRVRAAREAVAHEGRLGKESAKSGMLEGGVTCAATHTP